MLSKINIGERGIIIFNVDDLQGDNFPSVTVPQSFHDQETVASKSLTNEVVDLQASIGMRPVHNVVEEQYEDSKLVIHWSDASICLSEWCAIIIR